jgi:dihydrofolate synthase/folylpolyglutamate synthase
VARSYAEALDYIHGLQRFGSRLGLERVRRLLRAVGDPHVGLRVVHVAGTNGKGSVSAMTASILQAAGYRVGLYISPYVIDFRERIQVDGTFIPEDELAELVWDHLAPAAARLAAAGPDAQVTEFELVTALGFLHFARSRVDFLVCEVGLGGRFDATNVIDRPALAVVTSIGFDHTDRLGVTLREIAAEKAGVLKRAAPAVSAPQEPEALEVIAAAARRRGCPFYLAGREEEGGHGGPGPGVLGRGPTGGLPVSTGGSPRAGRVRLRQASLRGQILDYRGPGFSSEEGLALPLLGPHQVDNAATALTAVGVLKAHGLAPGLDSRALREGLARTAWPARFEVFGDAPPVVVDGAHNPPGARCLARALRELLPGRRLVLVLGLLGDKDVDSFLRALLPPELPEVAAVVATQPPSPRAMPAVDLAARILALGPGLEVAVRPGVGEAVRQAVGLAGPSDAVCVAGSIYQAGEAREAARAAVESRREGRG